VDVPREPSVDGAVPAPPPRTIWFAASNADEAIVVVPLKYRTPPDVPDVSPVPPWVTDSVPVAVDKSTVGDDHDPSPRQKVELLAPVPDARLETGRLPVTSLAKFTLVTSSVSVFLVDPSFLVAMTYLYANTNS
jgi:hypothetical protein